MIVRINQFGAAHAEQLSGWPDQGATAAMPYLWPGDFFAYELLIRATDEHDKPLPEHFRRAQLRQLIPEVMSAMRAPGEELVVRLDGPQCELVAALTHLSGDSVGMRHAMGAVVKLDASAPPPHASLRISGPLERLTALVADDQIGLDLHVRLRIVALPTKLVEPALVIESPKDPRWSQILPHVGFVLGNVTGMGSLQLISRRLDPASVRNLLMDRLLAQPPSHA